MIAEKDGEGIAMDRNQLEQTFKGLDDLFIDAMRQKPGEKVMRIYLLKRRKQHNARYDEAMGFVVRAATVQEARAIASENAGDEGREMWMDANQTICTALVDTGKPGLILSDFLRG